MSLSLDEKERIVYADGRIRHLTEKECGILSVLMKHPDCVMTIEEIYRDAWAEEPFSCRPTIYVHMRHLRRKIERDPDCPKHLLMAWGKGYMYHP